MNAEIVESRDVKAGTSFSNLARKGPAQRPALQDIISAAKNLAPYLAANAQATEAARQVSDEVTQLFRQAGFFKLMQPASFGGYEYGFTALIDVVSELGRSCTSSAWACSLAIVHQWLLGTFPAAAQQDVWGADPNAILCGSYAPTNTAAPVEGGVVVQGKWDWLSNVDNSQWALLGVHFAPGDKYVPTNVGFVLVPRAEWSIEDNWHVAGQAGTGSKSVVIEKPTYVPAHRKLTFAEASSNAPPGALANANPLYRIPFLSAVPVCLVSPLLGTAQGAIETFIALCAHRITRGAVAGGGHRLNQFYPAQSRLGQAAAAVDAAKLLIYRDTAEVEQLAAGGVAISIEKRIRNRRDHAYATKLAHEAIDGLFQSVGGAGLSLDQPIQRMWRDSNAIARHISLNWDAVSAMAGQQMLGLEPKGQY